MYRKRKQGELRLGEGDRDKGRDRSAAPVGHPGMQGKGLGQDWGLQEAIWEVRQRGAPEEDLFRSHY